MEKEIWKDVVGYEGYYDVSNLGRVRSVDRFVSNMFGTNTLRKSKLKKLKDQNRYKRVGLNKDGKKKLFLVHRLVAEAFIPNPNNLPEINHIDENPSNNNVSNLEWCSRDYNLNYGTRGERISDKNKISLIGKNINNPSLSKAVLQFTLDGEFVAEYPSTREAERQTGIKNQSISLCCKGVRLKSTGGYKWCFKSE